MSGTGWLGRRTAGVVLVVAGLAGASTSAAASHPSAPRVAGAPVSAADVAVGVTAPAAATERAARGPMFRLVSLPGCDSRAVFTVGDSLTVGIVDFGGYSTLLEQAGFASTNVAAIGKVTSWGTLKLREKISEGAVGGIVVAGLGTNDARWASPSTTGAFRQRVDEFMQAAGPDRTVVWVNLQLGKPGLTGYATLVAKGNLFNQVLQEQSLVWPNLVVLDWNSTPNRQYLYSDQLHYTGTGYRNRAAAIVEAVKDVSCRED